MVKVPDQTGPRMRFQYVLFKTTLERVSLTSRLTGGSSIHTMSALLLQLLQASGHDVIAKVRKLRSRALDAEVLGDGAERVDVDQEVCSAYLATTDSLRKPTSARARWKLSSNQLVPWRHISFSVPARARPTKLRSIPTTKRCSTHSLPTCWSCFIDPNGQPRPCF